MESNISSGLTEVLRAAAGGDGRAREDLFQCVYDELRQLATRLMSHERQDHILQPTALVHETYMKLIRGNVGARGRAEFFKLAAHAMRQVLVDHARKRRSMKRGAGVAIHSLDETVDTLEKRATAPLVDLNEALEKLASLSP